ncbi:MAG: ornithine cyclodeaminase family protein, partial [Armatimonadetes bacterium]|nr:ornithine cyclodeaminase family protein [Armatimonadota bacterium]
CKPTLEAHEDPRAATALAQLRKTKPDLDTVRPLITDSASAAVPSAILLHRNAFGPAWLPWAIVAFAAVSAVATRVLARKDARDLAIIGSGTQARSHLEAMAAVRDLRRVRVWSRNLENAQHFAEWARPIADVEVAQTAAGAVEGAEVICTVTGSKEPVIQGEWISPGSHINAVGACIKTARELDSAAVARSRLFVDCRESAFNEAGDFLIPRQEGLFGDDHVRAELGEVLAGRAEGRKSDEEITLFKSLGIAVEDLAAAHYIYRKAQVENVGLSVELGGRRHGAS